VKLGEGEDKDIAKMVGTIKRKNYTRCQQLSIENNKIYLLSIVLVIQLRKSFKPTSFSASRKPSKDRKE